MLIPPFLSSVVQSMLTVHTRTHTHICQWLPLKDEPTVSFSNLDMRILASVQQGNVINAIVAQSN